ncbi:MAG: thioredoxin family protein [Bacteroidales bacterium]
MSDKIAQQPTQNPGETAPAVAFYGANIEQETPNTKHNYKHMKQLLVLIMVIITGIATNVYAQDTTPDSLNRIIKDPVGGDKILIGEITLEGLEKIQAFHSYYQREYQEYTPNNDLLRSIQTKAGKHQVIILLGTWCIDSKQQVPRFIKILESINFPMENVRIYAVDRNKESNEQKDMASRYALERIPTFIFIDANGNETGRIVERPASTLEKDMINIF